MVVIGAGASDEPPLGNAVVVVMAAAVWKHVALMSASFFTRLEADADCPPPTPRPPSGRPLAALLPLQRYGTIA